MKVIYDQTADTLVIIFTETPVAESDENKPSVILDYDSKGNLVSLEILDASQQMSVLSKAEVVIMEVVEPPDMNQFGDQIKQARKGTGIKAKGYYICRCQGAES